MENKNGIDEELCEEGRILWLDIFDGCEYSVKKYNRYMDHIKSCEECRRRLGIDDVITESELESLVRVEKAGLSSYAEGVRDALVLAAVGIVLAVVGALVFL